MQTINFRQKFITQFCTTEQCDEKKKIVFLDVHPQLGVGTLVLTAILLKGWIWPIGGVASRGVCSCSLRSSLVFHFMPCCFKQCTNLQQHKLEEQCDSLL